MRKKVTLLFLVIFLVAAFPALAQTIDEAEIRSAGPVTFINYVGPITGKAATFKDYVNIGKYMGRQIVPAASATVKYGIKYSIIHSYEPEIEESLDADILILHKYAQIDNIGGIRIVIAGHLMEAYGYSYDDAILLAEFVTYYNAVHYQDLEYFNARYKPGVMSNLSPKNAGMALHYSRWAGLTRIVIPLRGVPKKGDLSTVDTTKLTEEKVVEKMKEEDQKKPEAEKDSTEKRKDLVDLKERDVEQDKEEIDKKIEENKKEQEKVEERLEELENKDPLTEAEKEEKQVLEEKKEELKKEEEVLKKQEEQIVEKEKDIVKDRDSIADDENVEFENESKENKAVTDTTENVTPNPFLFLMVDDKGVDGATYGHFERYDYNSGKQLLESPVTSVRGRDYIAEGSEIVVIAGKSSGAGAVKLIKIDGENLEMLSESSEAVYEASFLIKVKDYYCALIVDSGKYYVALFNKDLKLVSKSSEVVFAYTTATLFDGKLLLQDAKSHIRSFNVSGLEQEKVIPE